LRLETENVQLGILVTNDQDLISTAEQTHVPRAFSTKNLVRSELRVCRTGFGMHPNPSSKPSLTPSNRPQLLQLQPTCHYPCASCALRHHGLGGHMVNQTGIWFAFLNMFHVSQLPSPIHHMTTSMEHKTVMAAPA